jgi:ribosomal-protein-alanine N-acetyltransferase
MQKRPRSERDSEPPTGARPSTVVLDSWQNVPPVLRGARVILREPCRSDALALLSALATNEVARFIVPPPDTVEGFEQFIAEQRAGRSAGQSICFGVVPEGYQAPVGIFQVRQLEPGFKVAEWGFALASEFWGEGLFYAAAPPLLDWVFGTLETQRLEARSAITNGRGNGALRKLGAVQEAVLRQSLLRHGEYLDQLLWTLTAEQWRAQRPPRAFNVH